MDCNCSLEQVQVAQHQGGNVKISTPVSVINTVCSNCAARPPSCVTTVQLSDHSWHSALPSVIIGSMVNIIPGRSSIVSVLRKCLTNGAQ
mmetsp:Transcript_46110/g.96832  ORF Transcript_46110/g.96832 Transcript_46110/m.96832 type:complete len:90 (-) Transcript_46110:415-684(-)